MHWSVMEGLGVSGHGGEVVVEEQWGLVGGWEREAGDEKNAEEKRLEDERRLESMRSCSSHRRRPSKLLPYAL